MDSSRHVGTITINFVKSHSWPLGMKELSNVLWSALSTGITSFDEQCHVDTEVRIDVYPELAYISFVFFIFTKSL